MLANHTQRSLETAAVKTMERIRRDRGRVVRRLQPLLQHIEEHLFDPGLDVNQLKRSCGVRDNSVPIQFHAQLGLPPHAYIEECRLRTGCRLLRDTEFKIWQIADLLGYSSIQVFSRAFSRWAGMRPTGFRRKARREGIAIPSRVLKATTEVAARATVTAINGHSLLNGAKTNGTNGARENGTRINGLAATAKTNGQRNGHATVQVNGKGSRIEVENLRRALDGELEATAADQLIRRLLNLYPANDTATSTTPAVPTAGVMSWQQLGANGHGSNGHGSNGHGSNGHGSNGHGSNGHGSNGHGTNGQRSNSASGCGNGCRGNGVEPTLTAIAAGAVGGLLDTEQIEGVRAEEVWKKIKGEVYEAQVAAVQHEYRFRTPALFHHLCERSRVDGRDNRKNGVRVAELALVALEAVRFYVTSEKEFAILQGKAYAWLGNALRLAMDFVGAEKALENSSRFLPESEEAAPIPWAELFQNQAALRWHQRRGGEALPLCAQAVRLFHRFGKPCQIARSLILQAQIRRLDDDYDGAIDDLRAAIAHIDAKAEPYLGLAAFQSLADLLVRSGRFDQASTFLPKARELSERLQDQSSTLKLYVRWLEGLLAEGAGELDEAACGYTEARQGFLDSEALGVAALVSLDLGLLMLKVGRNADAVICVKEIIPVLSSLKINGEALVALGVVQEAVKAGAVTDALLRRVRIEAERASGSG